MDIGITQLREQLVGKADGIVLETCIGHGLNYPYYRMGRIKKLIGLDWVQRSNSKSE